MLTYCDRGRRPGLRVGWCTRLERSALPSTFSILDSFYSEIGVMSNRDGQTQPLFGRNPSESHRQPALLSRAAVAMPPIPAPTTTTRALAVCSSLVNTGAAASAVSRTKTESPERRVCRCVCLGRRSRLCADGKSARRENDGDQGEHFLSTDNLQPFGCPFWRIISGLLESRPR